MSEETGIDVEIRGIPAARYLFTNLPKEMIGEGIRESLDESLDTGISLMTMHIIDSLRTEKATGELADSVAGSVETKAYDEESGKAEYLMRIGSKAPHSKYAAREIGWSSIKQTVYIDPPGHFRFIGLRPPIPKHPFRERTLNDVVTKVIPEAFKRNWIEKSAKLQAEVDQRQEV